MFTWDPAKAIANFDKHGVSFEEAATAFTDPGGFEIEDLAHSGVESRTKRLATSGLGRVLLIVFTVRRKADGKETIRIISARQASRKERKAYDRS